MHEDGEHRVRAVMATTADDDDGEKEKKNQEVVVEANLNQQREKTTGEIFISALFNPAKKRKNEARWRKRSADESPRGAGKSKVDAKSKPEIRAERENARRR